jgi:hypothetical protein
MEWMKALLNEIRHWQQTPAAYVRYSWALTQWMWLLRARRVRGFVTQHAGVVRRLALVGLGLGAGLIVVASGPNGTSKEVLVGYLIAAGAMTGGAIAIIFSISIFLLQGVADLYSSKHFNAYTNGWRDRSVYGALVAITIAMFGTALRLSTADTVPHRVRDVVIISSLLLVGATFALIDWQYELVRQKVSPANAILFLRTRGLRFIADVQADAERVARILTAQRADVTEGLALATAYNRFLRSPLNDVNRQMESLLEVSLKLADRQELETAKRGLAAMHDLLARVLEARKTSSIAIPSSTFLLAVESDSEALLTKSLERMNKAGEKFIIEGKDELATYIVEIYGSLASAAKEITYLPPSRENPILDRVVGYLHLHIKYGASANNLEVMFQGARVLGNISAMAAEKGLATTLAGLQQRVMEVAVAGMQRGHLVVVDRCSEIFPRNIAAVFESDALIRDHSVEDSLKNIATLAVHLHTLIGAGALSNGFAGGFSLTKGYDALYEVFVIIDSRYAALTDETSKRRFRGDVTDFFEALNTSLRRLSEELRSCDSILITSIAGLLFQTNRYMVAVLKDREFADQHGETRKVLSWNSHLPSWFAHHAPKVDASSYPFITLAESVAKTGVVIAVELGDTKLLQDAVDCLVSMAGHSLTKSVGGYGYGEPRIMEKACLLGIFALKRGWSDVVAKLKLQIVDFESSYFTKYLTKLPTGLPADFDPHNHNIMGLPHDDQLLRELVSWKTDIERGEWNGGHMMRDDAQSMTMELIDASDIDRFIAEIWGMTVKVKVTRL